ncbi:unnamed protein product, partial [Trichobilharzia regenti]
MSPSVWHAVSKLPPKQTQEKFGPVLFKFSSPIDARKSKSSNKLISSFTPYGNVRLAHDLTPCQRSGRASASTVANAYLT